MSEIEQARVLVKYLTLPVFGFFLYHAILGLYYRFAYKIKSAIWYFGMSLLSSTYALGVFFQSHDYIGSVHHLPVIKMVWVSGFIGFICYLNMVKEFFDSEWKLFNVLVKALYGIYGASLFLLMIGIGYEHGAPEPGITFHKIFQIGITQTLFGKALGVFLVISTFAMNFLVLKRLLNQKSRETVLCIGVIVTILCSMHDTVFAVADGKFAVVFAIPIFYLGNVLEAIRFSMHYQNRLYEKVNFLRQEKKKAETEGEFSRKILRVLSHDISNGLLVLRWVYENVKKDINDPNNLKRHLFKMDKSLKSVEEVSDTVKKLEVTRAGKLKLELEKVSLLEVISRTVESLSEKSSAKNIMIEVSGLKLDHCVIAETFSLINQVFSNLLSNAIKFSNKNSRIEIACQETEKDITVEVRDFGTGMKPSSLKQVFSKDKIYSSKGTEGEKGTGFGLQICKEFVEAFGGSLEIESELGEGTTVKVSLLKHVK